MVLVSRRQGQLVNYFNFDLSALAPVRCSSVSKFQNGLMHITYGHIALFTMLQPSWGLLQVLSVLKIHEKGSNLGETA